MYELPKYVIIDGKKTAIRSDYRDILEIIKVLQNEELQESVMGDERVICALYIFYPALNDIKNGKGAWEELVNFIDKGNKPTGVRKQAPLYDFIQDESMIVPAIGQVLGCRIRELEYLHWWDFVDAFMQVGDGMFANVVGVRNRKQKGKMTKEDKELYKNNRELVDLKVKMIFAQEYFKPLTFEEGNEVIRKWREGKR